MADVRVVVQALLDAHRGVRAVMDELGRHRVNDLVAVPTALGHPGLGAVTADFGDRWAVGLANLTDDGNALADALISSARDYAATEHLTLAGFR